MSNVAKLKKKAAEFEQKKQLDKALALYVQILEVTEASGSPDDEDVALYNRVGDLMLRDGRVAEALGYYEKAVDLYAESGFFNNAIALCNKILRQSPGRTSVYYKLGKVSARKGFKSDAKQNFLEYADRMQKAGQLDEAFRALKEFADLCPDQDDIRLMLAEQLSKRERKGEALEQLQTLYDKLTAEGREAEARATVDRMKAIDPNVEPRAGAAPQERSNGGLVFLDVSYDDASGARGRQHAPPPHPPRAATPPRPTGAAGGDLPFIHQPGDESAPPSAAPPPPVAGLEFTAVAGLEPTSAAGADDAPLTGAEFGALSLGESVDPAPLAKAHDLALPGELPPIDLLSVEPGSAFGDAGGFGSIPDLTAPFGSLDALDTIDAPFSLDVEAAPIEIGDGPLEFVDLGGTPGAAGAAPATGVAPLGGAGGGAAAAPPGRPARPSDGDAAFLAMMAPEGNASPAVARAAAPSAPPKRSEFHPQTDAASFTNAERAGGKPSVESLRAEVERDEGNGALRQRYAEALLEIGEREGGMHELEAAMHAFERADDLDGARGVADAITRINPGSIRHHQKRVEYAFRTNDKAQLCDAYLQLADALFRTGQAEKSRTVYKRVIDLNPDDVRARAALAALIDDAPPAGALRTTAPARAASPTGGSGVSSRPAPATVSADAFVNLGEMLRDDDVPRSTRMVVAEEEPTGDEAADFADMLRKFKQGVAENIDEDDHESHYDLGVAFKEMGLIDEAVAEFQKALRGPSKRARAFEALGQCFVEKLQFQVASTILDRALAEPGVGDDQLVGVLYLLGYAREALHMPDEALACYRRVFAIDIQFRDVADRLAALEQVAR